MGVKLGKVGMERDGERLLIQPAGLWRRVDGRTQEGGQRIDLHLINDERKDMQTGSRRTGWEKTKRTEIKVLDTTRWTKLPEKFVGDRGVLKIFKPTAEK